MGCASGKSKQKSTKPQATLDFSEGVILPSKAPHELKLLKQFFEVEVVSMHERVQAFYLQAFSSQAASLTQINLSFLTLGSEGALHLAQVLPFCSSLKELKLRKTKLGEDGCRYLSLSLGRMKAMEVINLEDNEIGPAGARYLANGLENLTRLKELTLHLNSLGPEGAAVFAPCLSTKPNLETLMLDENHIGKVGFAAILPYLDASKPALSQLGLGFNQLGSEEAVILANELKSRDNLKKLVLIGNPITKETMAWMKGEMPAVKIVFE